MTNRKGAASKEEAPAVSAQAETKVEETPFEALASICSVLVVGLFILTFLAQNFVIPSGSMENTLLIGDHLIVDRVTLSPQAKWIEPLVHYREPKHDDVIVFIKPVADSSGNYLYLVKRLIGLPGDHIHLRNGIVIRNGVAQSEPFVYPTAPDDFDEFRDDFPAVPPEATGPDGIPEAWAVAFPQYIQNGDLVVPPGMYFMMGDNRHNSLDSRYWGFVSRANIVGRPLFNYWSFNTPESEYEQTGIGNKLAWLTHVALHFFTETRWKRTFHVIH